MCRVIFYITLFLLSVDCFAQFSDSDNSNSNDSLTIFRGLNLEINIPYRYEHEKFRPEYFFNNSLSTIDVNSSTIRLATESFFNQPGFSGFTGKDSFNDMLEPLRIQYENDQELKTIKYILGMAQVGAVGYLAYKRIKKYGFR